MVARSGVRPRLPTGSSPSSLATVRRRRCGPVTTTRQQSVIVDGLWEAWTTPAESIDRLYAWIRTVADDPLAKAPAPALGLDPRTRHGYGLLVSERFARLFWGSIRQPVLAIETPASPTPPSERQIRLAWFGGPATLVELNTDAPHAVIASIEQWLRGVTTA